ncbi:hypothetical protein BSFA1_87310 (plasmid) [Burkholderia sp. SFA1]|nr:hypothetical protein BSFA1_87310 [Burkholderia sp. SFA1]
MWIHEDSIETTASPARLWELLADVERWGDWNAGIERIELHGPFASGTRFTMQPPGQEAFISTLLDVRPNEGFLDETIVDGTRVLVDHQLISLQSGCTKIVYRTEITGPNASVFGPIVTSDFPDVLAALKRWAER